MIRAFVGIPLLTGDAAQFRKSCPRNATKVMMFNMVSNVESEHIVDAIVRIGCGAIISGAHGLITIVNMTLNLSGVCRMKSLRVEQ